MATPSAHDRAPADRALLVPGRCLGAAATAPATGRVR